VIRLSLYPKCENFTELLSYLELDEGI